MSLDTGRAYLAIPGPSVLPERVLRAMHRAAPNIYEGELPDMVPGLLADLRALAGTAGRAAIWIANGHAAWEAAIANTLLPGDRVLVLATGRFALGWSEIAERLGVVCETLDFGMRAAVDPARLAERLAADPGHALRAVLLVHADTSTSALNDVAAVRAALDAAGHPALLMIDCIASFAADRYEMDAWGADVTVTASQKGLMTPPGLGILLWNARADAARDRARPSHYWDWRPRAEPAEFWRYFDGTAPTHHLFGLREALDMIAEEGRPALWSRHETLARAIWAAVAHWGGSGDMALNIAGEDARSRAVTTIHLGGGNATRLRRWCAANTGLTLGIGLGWERSDDVFRIGHMGHVNAHMILGALGAIEAGLAALGIPHRPGGVSAAARVVADRADALSRA